MHYNDRSGLSLIEVIVVIGILGILFAMLLPAVQQARSAASRMECTNNLRQIGLGFHHHVDVHGHFPTDDNLGVFVELLPYLEQSELYDDYKAQSAQPPFGVSWIGCPKDPNSDPGMALASYLTNDGTQLRTRRRRRGELNGFRTGRLATPLRPADISDGLSTTAAMSEHLIAGETGPDDAANRRRRLWYTEQRFAEPGQEDSAIEQCRQHRTTTQPSWIAVNGGAAFVHGVGYDHMLPPNHEGCYNGPEDFDLSVDHILVAPTSLHPGGVNLMLGDGSVHFVADQIDLTVWRALGTRNGNEPARFP